MEHVTAVMLGVAVFWLLGAGLKTGFYLPSLSFFIWKRK